MKKTAQTLLMALFCLLFFTSCNNTQNENGDAEKKAEKASAVDYSNSNYVKVIPDNALVVQKINLGNLVDKSGILKNAVIKAKYEEAAKDIPREIKQLFDKIYSNPSKSGININSPAFFALDGVKPSSGIITCEMENIQDFEAALQILAENQIKPIERNGMKCVEIDRKVAFAYDSEKLLFVFNERGADIDNYINLPENRIAANSPKFAGYFKNNDDLTLVVNIERVMELAYAEIGRNKMPSEVYNNLLNSYKNSVLTASLDFKDGKVTLNSNINLPQEDAGIINDVIRKSNHSHFGYIPANSIAVLNYNFDLKSLYNHLESKGLLKELEKEHGAKEFVSAIASALSGEWTAAVWIDRHDQEKPFLIAIADCNDRFVFDLIVAETRATYIDNDVYAMNLNRRETYNYYTDSYEYVTEGPDYYIIYKDNKIMVMPESHYYKLKSGNGINKLSNSANNNNLFRSMNSNLVIDVNAIHDIILKNSSRMDEEEMMILEIIGMVHDITASFNIGSLDINANMTDKSTNSLKTIVDKGIGFAIKNMNKRQAYYDEVYDNYYPKDSVVRENAYYNEEYDYYYRKDSVAREDAYYNSSYDNYYDYTPADTSYYSPY